MVCKKDGEYIKVKFPGAGSVESASQGGDQDVSSSGAAELKIDDDVEMVDLELQTECKNESPV